MDKKLCDSLVKAMPNAPVTAKMYDSLVPGMPGIPRTIRTDVDSTIYDFKIIKHCSFEFAVRQGFGGTPEKWESIKEQYTKDLVASHGPGVEIDYTNILYSGQGIVDEDGISH